MSDFDRALIAERKSTIHTAESNEFSAQYDYVMVFKMDGSAGAYNVSNMAKFCLNQMKNAGLETFSYQSVQMDELIVLIRCPVDVMKKFADETDFKMELQPAKVQEYLKKGIEENGVYKIKPIFINDQLQYTDVSPYNYIFAKYETSLDQELYNDFEDERHKSGQWDPENPHFAKHIRLKLINYILRAPVRQGGCAIKITKLLHKKRVLAYYPLHDRFVTSQLREHVMNKSVWPWNFPFEEYRAYFGEKITLFQVFLGHYSRWLLYPSLIGIIFQLVVWGTGNYSHPVLPFYSLIITLWCIVMLENWKRAEALTAMRWGMTDFEDQEPDRPEFHGELIKSYVTGEDMLYFPSAEIWKRAGFSRAVIGAFILLVVGVVASIYVLRFSLQSSLGAGASTLASVLNTVQITVFNMVYQKIALHLTNVENHRTDTMYEDSMIIKLFMFQFINSYASFFFLAFIASSLDKPDDVSEDYQGQCGATNCMEPLSVNLAIIFGTRLVIKNLTDLVLPWYSAKTKRANETKGVESASMLTPAEEDYVLINYDSMIEGITNYADLAIQYGFSVLFITALPIASFLSLMSNYVKAKVNGWKLTTLYQRPIPLGAQDIGTWLMIFQVVSVAAVITNAGLICFTMDVLNQYDIYGRSWIFIGFQWTLIAIQFVIEQMIPDVPEEAIIQQKRNEFIVSKIIERVEDEEQVSVAEFEAWKNQRHEEADESSASGHAVSIQTYPSSSGGLTSNPLSY